jgi:hypothetical protein
MNILALKIGTLQMGYRVKNYDFFGNGCKDFNKISVIRG